jgi:hypothetical protein
MQKSNKRPRPLRLAVLIGAVTFLTAIGSAAAVAPASAASTPRPAVSRVIPIPPAGWHPKTIARIWQDPRATTRLETLPPAACKALNQQHPGAVPTCQVRDYILDIRQPLPPGTRFITANGAKASPAAMAAASASYTQFHAYATQCSPLDGCRAWNTQLEAWGVYNGTYVYQWGVFCNAAAEGPSNQCTWHGFFDNGGAYLPSFGVDGMQFGDDGTAKESEVGINYEWDYGQRFYVDTYGTAFGWYNWY